MRPTVTFVTEVIVAALRNNVTRSSRSCLAIQILKAEVLQPPYLIASAAELTNVLLNSRFAVARVHKYKKEFPIASRKPPVIWRKKAS